MNNISFMLSEFKLYVEVNYQEEHVCGHVPLEGGHLQQENIRVLSVRNRFISKAKHFDFKHNFPAASAQWFIIKSARTKSSVATYFQKQARAVTSFGGNLHKVAEVSGCIHEHLCMQWKTIFRGKPVASSASISPNMHII
jgi:hypothetical protein